MPAFLASYEQSIVVRGVFGDEFGQDIPANIATGTSAVYRQQF